MEYTEHYENMEERNTLCGVATSNGFRMLHDNFDPDWKRGDEPHGTMTFTDIMPITPEPEPVRDLAAEIDGLKAKIAILEKGLNVGTNKRTVS